ncbi:unnamed protein product, partial [Rotaria sordida]
SLITTSSSRIIVDPAAGTITATDLAISEIGMYIIKLQITSSNRVYSFPFTSNGILVKENSTVLEVFTGFPTSNITYNVDYDSYVANGQLEILRATIYNYLYFVVKLPISSNIVLVKGSTICALSFNSGTLGRAQALLSGFTSMLTSRNAISGVPLSSINFLGRSYTVSSDSSSSSSSDGSNIGLIVGLVVGLVGGTIVIVGIIFGFYQCQLKNKGLRLVNNVEEVNSYPNQLGRNNENTTSPVRPVDDGSHLIRRTSITSPTPSNFDNNRLHSPLSNDANEKRAPSASVSITMLGPMSSAAQTRPCTPMSAVELIKLD